MFFEFKKNDIYVNRIKTNPESNFFIHEGKIYLNHKEHELRFPETNYWTHYDATARAVLTAVEADAFNAHYDIDESDHYIFTAFQTDTTLGDEAEYRGLFSIANSSSSTQNFLLWSRNNPTGELRPSYRNNSGASIMSTAGSHVVFDGDLHIAQINDLGSTPFQGLLNVKIDNETPETTANYPRAGVTTLNTYAVAGDFRAGTTFGFKGWVYCHILVLEDMSSHNSAIQTAWATALNGDLSNLKQAYEAALATIVANVSDTDNIKFSQAFYAGSTAEYGNDAQFINVNYTLAGDPP